MIRLPNKVDDARRQVIHCACNRNGSVVLKAFQDRTPAANLAKSKHYVRPRNGSNKGGILAGLLTIKSCCRNETLIRLLEGVIVRTGWDQSMLRSLQTSGCDIRGSRPMVFRIPQYNQWSNQCITSDSW